MTLQRRLIPFDAFLLVVAVVAVVGDAAAVDLALLVAALVEQQQAPWQSSGLGGFGSCVEEQCRLPSALSFVFHPVLLLSWTSGERCDI